MRHAKLLFVGLIIAVAIVAYLAMEQTRSTTRAVDDVAVAAGDIEYEGEERDLTSPEPFVHCYPVPDSSALDMSSRVDFEARTTKGWVPAPEEAAEGEFCLIESEQAVQKRLEEHGAGR